MWGAGGTEFQGPALNGGQGTRETGNGLQSLPGCHLLRLMGSESHPRPKSMDFMDFSTFVFFFLIMERNGCNYSAGTDVGDQ